jgi:hypothetical protein
VDRLGDGVDLVGESETAALMAHVAGGAAAIRYSAGGLINAIAAR